jgi:hypothetical protein
MDAGYPTDADAEWFNRAVEYLQRHAELRLALAAAINSQFDATYNAVNHFVPESVTKRPKQTYDEWLASSTALIEEQRQRHG